MGMYGESTSNLLNETIIKQLTGDDQVSLRFLFKEFFDTTLFMKLYLIGNDKPVWRHTGPMMNRVAYFNFVNRFVDKKTKPFHRKKDDQLVSDLLGSDKDQVFTLLMRRASILYKERKLVPSPFMKVEFKKYVSEIDTSTKFLNLLKPKKKAGLTAKDIHEKYCTWCSNENVKAEKKGDFVKKLKKMFSPRAVKFHNNTVYDIDLEEDYECDEENDILSVEQSEIRRLKALLEEKEDEIKKLKKMLEQADQEIEEKEIEEEDNQHEKSHNLMLKKLHAFDKL